MKAHNTEHPLLTLVLITCLSFVFVGCKTTSPDVSVAPTYRGGSAANPAAKPTALRLMVSDGRSSRGTSVNGQEVLTSGDKGKVYIKQQPTAAVQQALAQALKTNGYTVDSAAPVVLDVKLRRMALSAIQFTHWGLPSERGSTLDAVGAVLPGPVRETKATTVLEVNVRKHGQALGLTYYIEKTSAQTSDQRSVVESVLSSSLTAAINDAIAKSAQGIELASILPVSDAEIDARTAELDATEQRLAELSAELQQQQQTLMTDRSELAKFRQDLERERAIAIARTTELKAAAAQIAQQQAALDAKTDAYEKLKHEAEQDAQVTAQERAKLEDFEAMLRRERESLDKASLEHKTRSQQFSLSEEEFKAQQQRLTERMSELEQREQETQRLRAMLAVKDTELEQKSKALSSWSQQLERKADEVKPPQDLVEDMQPMIAVIEPQPRQSVTTNRRVTIKGVVVDDQPVAKVVFKVNGTAIRPDGTPDIEGARGLRFESDRPVGQERGPGIVSASTHAMKAVEFAANLRPGQNTVTIEAWDATGQHVKEDLQIDFREPTGRTFVVCVGINKYQTVPKLRYAVNDADAMAKALTKGLGVEEDDLYLLLDEDATLQNIKHTLGVALRSRVSKQDTVVIYFSGHGAPEEDNTSPDKDGLEKYLLPFDADLSSFYSTALPMKDVSEIFRRLPCQRLVFIADTCYSGAAGEGARTLSPPNKTFRALRMENTMKRVGGTGRVIMTASAGNEISQEREELGHGVFTYYVLQGLSGKADKNRDRAITVTELFDYASTEVARATGNNQNPVLIDDEAVGDIVLSRVNN